MPTGESTDSVRTMLWERWVDQADQRGKDLRGFAVALATTARATGAAELRVERLGNAATRRAWFALKGAIVAVAASGTAVFGLALIPFIGRSLDTLAVVLDGAFVRRMGRHPRLWLAGPT